MLGPFSDYQDNPILVPGLDPNSFDSRAAFNPTVIKEEDTFYMFYRGENVEGCSRGMSGAIGLATGKDSLHFIKHREPVIVPDQDYDKYGCDDPRIVRIQDTYYLTYVGNDGVYGKSTIRLATSEDLYHWEKHGTILNPQAEWAKGQVKAGVIIAQKIGGRFIMYYLAEREPWKGRIGIAYSDDLLHWHELGDKPVMSPREGYFDSLGVEPGPTPVVTEEGIILIYGGWKEDWVYKVGEALFSKEDPTRLLERSEVPILSSAQNWGEFFGGIPNHAVPEGLVRDGKRWLLYYGAADKACCVAISEEGAEI